MKHRRVISVIAMVMLLGGLMVSPVSAQPPKPCFFQGDVTLDGAACVGSTVSAEIDGVVVKTATVAAMEIAGVMHESYYILVIDTLEEPPADPAVTLYVDGIVADTLGPDEPIWEDGGTKTVNLEAFTGVVTRYTLTVNVSPAGSGSVSLSPTQPADGYVADTVVTLTATAAADYEFSSWGGDASGTSATTTVTMTSDKSVTAYFESTVVPPPAETFADWLYNTFIA